MTVSQGKRIQIVGEATTDISVMLEEAGFTVAPDAEVIWVMPGAAHRLPDDLYGLASLTVFQPPLPASDYERAFRAARTSNAAVRIVDPDRRLAAAEEFVAAANALRRLSPITNVRAHADPDRLYGLLHLLSDSLGRIRPGPYHPSTSTSSGTVAGAPLEIDLHKGRPTRVSVISDAGELMLIGPHGPVVWQPAHGAGELIGPAPSLADSTTALRAAVIAELDTRETTTSALSRSQQEVSLCRLLDALAIPAPGEQAATPAAGLTAVRPLHAADILARPSPEVFTAPFALLARQTADAAGTAASDPEQIAGLERATAVTDRYSRAAMHQLIRPVLPAASTAEVVTALGTSPRHAWLVRRWLTALRDSGELHQDEYGALSARADPSPASAAALAEAYADLGFNPLMARLHTAIVGSLGELIRDELRVEEILFSEQDVVPALAAYQDNVATRYLNAALADTVTRTASDASLPRPLKVVELGGGAGVCTAAVLESLQDSPVDYLFTDISPTLLSSAQHRFGIRLRPGLLDINADFIDQDCGLQPGSIDVVIAANVLHNATHVGQSLRRIRRVLRPGGLLGIVESTRESHAVLTSMAFLLSPLTGTRASDEIFLDRQSWRQHLAGAGFAVAFDLPEQHSPLSLSGQHLILGVAL